MNGQRTSKTPLVAIAGTGTEVGKTWFAVRLAVAASSRGLIVAARKPAQSFAPGDEGDTDADHLATATGATPFAVCPSHRWYATPMAPVMAAGVLGKPAFTIDELVAEIHWPAPPDPEPDLCLVETAGGLRSPLATDGDSLELIAAVGPSEVILVADAGLGTLHECRSAAEALARADVPMRIVLNRYDHRDSLHRANREWLLDRDGLRADPADEVIKSLIDGLVPGHL